MSDSGESTEDPKCLLRGMSAEAVEDALVLWLGDVKPEQKDQIRAMGLQIGTKILTLSTKSASVPALDAPTVPDRDLKGLSAEAVRDAILAWLDDVPVDQVPKIRAMGMRLAKRVIGA